MLEHPIRSIHTEIHYNTRDNFTDIFKYNVYRSNVYGR